MVLIVQILALANMPARKQLFSNYTNGETTTYTTITTITTTKTINK